MVHQALPHRKETFHGMSLQSAAGDTCGGREAGKPVIKLNVRAELMQRLSKAEYQAAKVNTASALSF